MGDQRGKGYQTPAEDNPPHEQDESFTVPEKDPGKHLTVGKRRKGQCCEIGKKVREFPSHT